MNPYYTDEAVTLFHGDNRDVLATLPSNSVDACVTDPPYELGFMGRRWDASGIAYDKYLWAEVWRVLKPGGHLLAFGGTRTWHRLAVAIEDAGFEVRDSMAWMYGSGFPKSLDVSKAIDKAAGELQHEGRGMLQSGSGTMTLTPSIKPSDYVKPAPATEAAKQWQGWGTALKPAFEPVVVARKPLIGTVSENVQQYGTGALNIDGCRIETTDSLGGGAMKGSTSHAQGWDPPWKNDAEATAAHAERVTTNVAKAEALGRWPANVILDESQAAELDRQSGDRPGFATQRDSGHKSRGMFGSIGNISAGVREGFNDTGGASRFFYTAKASSAERPNVDGIAHPTVKPLELMQYLVRLVTPPGGTVLEPFAGSGTTAEACIVEGFKCIAIEMTDEYLPLIVQRISKPIEMTLL